MLHLPISFQCFLLPEVESTNLHAIEQVHAGLASHGYVYYTPKQTSGKGQRGKTWVTEHGKNLTLSVVLQTLQMPISHNFRLSAMVALATANFCRQAGAKDVCIKWPNDIYLGDRKAGGILIENVLQGGRWSWSVAGIGLNINQQHFVPPAGRATSLCLAIGAAMDLKLALHQLLEQIGLYWEKLQNGGWHSMLQEYNQQLFGRNLICRLRKDNAVIPCLIRRVNDHGMLLAGESEEWHFDFGEVSWVLE